MSLMSGVSLTPPPSERLRDSVTEVYISAALVLKFGMVYHLRSGLAPDLTFDRFKLGLDLCLHRCDEISAPSDY